MQMKNSVLLATLVNLALFGCAQAETKKEVENEVQAQPTRPMHGGVAYKGFEAIEASKLSDLQKAQLRELHGRMIGEIFANQEETSRLKGVLFETITKVPYKSEKVNVIKKRLIALNDQKMKSMFHALEEVEKVLGQVSAEQQHEILHDFFWENRSVGER